MELRKSGTIIPFVKYKPVPQEVSVLCEKCGLDFPEKKLLNRHMLEVHREDGQLICTKCFISFKSEEKYKVHIKLHVLSYFCEVCKQGFSKLIDFKNHQNTHKQLLKCRFCCLRMYRESAMKTHERKHTNANIVKEKLVKEKQQKQKPLVKSKVTKNFICMICDKTFTDSSQFRGHQKVHRDCLSNFKCNECDSIFKDGNALQLHLKEHKKHKYKVVCSECGKYFSPSNLKIHSWVHTGIKAFSCPECGKGYTTNGQLKIHMRIHTGELPYKCGHCDKMFTSSSSRKKHELIKHTDLKPYVCNVCGRFFRTVTSLKLHMRTHTGEKPFKCEVCFNSFSSCSGLRKHERIHSGERKYVCSCDVCGKQFANKYHLKNHYTCHSIERPYSCDKCAKTYKSMNGLRFHQKLEHLKIRPYVCSICFKGYVQKILVEKHLQSHYKNGMFNCDSCDKIFCNQQALRVHEIEHSRNSKKLIAISCALCGVGLSSKSCLKSHYEKRHSGKSKFKSKDFICNVCRKRFSTWVGLKRHAIMKETCSSQLKQFSGHSLLQSN